jgi:hypothetical protein
MSLTGGKFSANVNYTGIKYNRGKFATGGSP